MAKMLLQVIALLSFLQNVNSNGLCFIMYQIADNDLEPFLYLDNYEMTLSPAIHSPSTTSWIYFDFCNLNMYECLILDQPLFNVYNSDGTNVTGGKPTGSQYLRWDHDLGKMVIDRTLDVEQDSEAAGVLVEFVKTALQDCVAKGKTSYFIGLSDHGAGFEGMGVDMDPNLYSIMSNDKIATALRTALDEVEGAPERFDVVGFDACLMSDVGAASHYGDVAKFILASEAIEPGHGWAYDALTQSDTAEDLALDILMTFVSLPQGDYQQNPKTLALLNLDLLPGFLSAFDRLSAEMESLLSQEDPEFFTQFNRARSQTTAFEGALDGSQKDIFGGQKSMVDIGTLLQFLNLTCVPETGSTLQTLLDSTLTAYDDALVDYGAGKGTPTSTGMAIVFPKRRLYVADPITYGEYVNNATVFTPQWRSFLEKYYASGTPPTGSTSVCTLGTTPSKEASGNFELLIDPTLIEAYGGYIIESEISRQVDDGNILYGIDLTPLLSERRRLSHWREMHRVHKERRALTYKDTHDGQSLRSRLMQRSRRITGRNLQAGGDYFEQYAGDVPVAIGGSRMSGFWDKQMFWLITEDGKLEPIYVTDLGDGAFQTPVIYLPPSSPVTSADLEAAFWLSEDEFIALFGGSYGFLTFSSETEDENGYISNAFSLYTGESTFAEMSKQAGGQIVPIVYVYLLIEGEEYYSLVGGYNYTVVDWNEATNLLVYHFPAEYYMQDEEDITLIIDVVAFDDDNVLTSEGISFELFEFIIAQNGTIYTIDTGVQVLEDDTVGTDDVGSVGMDDNAGTTMCQVVSEGRLLIDPTLTEQDGGYLIVSEISQQVDSAGVMYGLDMTQVSWKRRELTRWHERHRATRQRRNLVKASDGNGYSPSSRLMRRSRRTMVRNLQSASADYFQQYAGDVPVILDGCDLSSFWDKQMFGLETEDGKYEDIYVSDLGNGTLQTPVIYLPPSSPVISADLEAAFLFSEEEFIAQFGGERGFLAFASDDEDSNGIISNAFSLYTGENSFAEKSKSAGGQIVPILYVYIVLDGEEYDSLVGGYNYTVIDWNEATNLLVYHFPAESYTQDEEDITLIIDIVAFDDENLLTEDFQFIIDQYGTVINTTDSVF